MWLFQNIVAVMGAALILAGCIVLRRRSTSLWGTAFVCSTVAFLVLAVGAELYMRHGDASPGFVSYMVEYQAVLTVALFFAASLSFFMVALHIRQPN